MEKINHKILGQSGASRITSCIYKIFELLRLMIGFVHKNKFTPTWGKKNYYGKRIIIMCGCPGTGKTTIAQQIHQVLNGTSVIIHRDSLRDLHLGKGFFYPDNNLHDAELKKIDSEFLEQAEKKLREYDTIILDAGFRNYSKRKAVYHIAHKHSCEVIVIHCTCNQEIAYQRLKNQIDRGEKCFALPVTWVIKYFFYDFDEPTKKSEPAAATIIRIETEQNQVTTLVPEENLSDFAKQLIQILESASLNKTSK